MEMPVNSPSVTVFAAFNTKHITAPFVFLDENGRSESVNGERYRFAIQNHLVPFMRQKRSFSSAMFQQDGAPPHTAHETQDLLRRLFGNRIISKGFEFQWPPYSPDLSPCDFWLWDHVKQKVYSPPRPETIYELIEKIRVAFSQITAENLVQAVHGCFRRCSLCLQCEGGHLEHVRND